jgi:hypothetical protein
MDNLSIHRLHGLYASLRKSGFLAGASKLYEIERALWKCFDEASGSDRIIAYTLATIIGRIVNAQDEQAVEASEGIVLANVLDQPIAQAMDFLIGKSAGADAAKIQAALVDAYAIFRKTRD